MAPYASSELELLYKHLDKVNKGVLLLPNRGYPNIALMFLLKTKGIGFCIRMKVDWWLAVKEFSESDKTDDIVSGTRELNRPGRREKRNANTKRLYSINYKRL